MAAAGQDYQAAIRVEHKRRILRNGIFGDAIRCLYFSGAAPVPFRMNARNGAQQPDSRKQGYRLVIFQKYAAGAFILRFQQCDPILPFSFGEAILS